MNRKLKTLGLAVVAVLAMSAVVATAAQAQFTASSYPTAATATSPKGNDDFKTEAGSVECKGHFAVAALTEASNTVTVTPTYSECIAFFFSATVHMNGCDYVFHNNGEVDLECPEGAAVTITAGPCEVDIPPQTGLKSVAFTNDATDITVKSTTKGITYNVTKDGFLCPFSGTGHKTGAEYLQNNAVTVNSTNGASISVDP